MAASVHFDRIEKRIGNKHILKGVSLDIHPGEFLTLVGPSGCGKSTLLRTVAGLLDQDSGTINIDGDDVSGKPSRDRNVAMVFQSYALYPHMTVSENIATPLRMRRLSAWQRLPLIGKWLPGSRAITHQIHEEVLHAAQQVQLHELMTMRPANLSGGQRQRVAVARAMVRKPKVFLMDEPLSNLDARLRVHMRAEIADLHKRLGSTFIYVTHDQVEAMTLSTRVAVMMEGEIIQVGAPAELFEKPVDIRVAKFIGTPEINLVSCTTQAGKIMLGDQVLPFFIPGCTDILTIGVRAEKLVLAQADDRQVPALHLNMRRVRTEVLGHDVLVYGHLDGAADVPLVFRLSVPEMHALTSRGDVLPLQASLGDLLVFDENGKRVDYRPIPLTGSEVVVHQLPVLSVM